MENENKKIVEINGVKIEVDLRTAKTVQTYKVGDKVKLLKKAYQGWDVCAGIIISFDEFKSLPTVVVAYIDGSYSADLKFANINSETKETEIAPAGDDFVIEKNEVIRRMDNMIKETQLKLDDLIAKKEYFTKKFNAYFEKI